MRRIRLLALACGLILYSSLSLSAEDDPRLKKIFDVWEGRQESLKTYHAKGKRFVYDSVFQVEKRGAFEFAWERDGRFIYRIEPVKIQEEQESSQRSKSGDIYSLESESAEIFYFPDQSEFWHILKSTAVRHKILSQDGLREMQLLPVVFPTALNREITKETQKEYWIKATDTRKSSFLESTYSEIKLILNRDDHTIRAASLKNPSKTTTTVYLFKETILNPGFKQNDKVFEVHEEDLDFDTPLVQEKFAARYLPNYRELLAAEVPAETDPSPHKEESGSTNPIHRLLILLLP